jgi:cobalt-zinc-cadmium efflux system protein
MGAEHDHTAGKSERSLWIALGLTSSILIAETIGGIVTGSLALISDAAHMLTDAAALAIALAAIRIGKRPADGKRSFGYYRFEILAAAFNAMMLFGVAMYILYEAYHRLGNPPEIQSTSMLWFAAVGLVANLISMKILTGGKDDSLNVKGAYLEVWSDLLGSIGVIAGAIIIKFTGWAWVDSAVAVAIGMWVLPRTWVLLKSSVNILLEGVPEDVDMIALQSVLKSVPGVISLHDLHVWSISSGKTSLTVHVVHAPEINPAMVPEAMRTLLKEKFGITHVTIQCELVPCDQADEKFHFINAISEHEEHEGHNHEHPHAAA